MSNYPTEESLEARLVTLTDLAAVAVDPTLELNADEVHVWFADLDQPSADNLRPLLAEDEVARAERFHFEKDRKHYINARGLLRQLLAVYLGVAAAEVQIEYAEKGKPFVSGTGINFNLAHSQGKAIYAFARGRDLGVDLEFMREDVGEEIAERFFSPNEFAALKELPPELTKEAFFNCWTRKEAYIKARGEGLSMPLDVFEVSLAPGEPAAFLRNQLDPAELSRWSMQSVSVPDGYVAALVVEGEGFRVKRFCLA